MTKILALFDLDGTLSSASVLGGYLKYYLKYRGKRIWILRFWAAHSALWLLGLCRLYSREKCRVKWIEDLSGAFKGASKEEIHKVFQWIVDNYLSESLRADVVEILQQHKRSGHMVIILSATFDGLLEVIGQRLAVTDVIGTKLEMIDGRCTGRIINPLCFGENKAKFLLKFLERNGLEIDSSASFAYADGAFDIPLLQLVGNPVATYPSKSLRRFAEANGWEILS